MIRKYHNHTLQTNPRHREEEPRTLRAMRQEDNLSKATSSLFIIEMIAKLERTPHTALQNKVETQNSNTMGTTINNESTVTEQSFEWTAA